ncbi:MAG TPA: hypothetical protein PLP27_09780 [Crocinitomicaceae bacterium]|nr:hypothetical protein [Crocinitomicaceae bacterium]
MVKTNTYSLQNIINKSWTALAAVFSFYISTFILYPATFWRFLGYFVISCFISIQIIYWAARFVQFVEDLRDK